VVIDPESSRCYPGGVKTPRWNRTVEFLYDSRLFKFLRGSWILDCEMHFLIKNSTLGTNPSACQEKMYSNLLDLAQQNDAYLRQIDIWIYSLSRVLCAKNRTS